MCTQYVQLIFSTRPLFTSQRGGVWEQDLSGKLYSSYVRSFTPVGTGAPTNVAARQTNPTSILVEWTPSSDATGYTISYSGGSSGSETVSGGDTNSYTLTGLTNGQTYTISIAATSNNLPSQVVTADMAVGLGKISLKAVHHVMVCSVPGNSEVVQSSTATDSITISVGFPAGSVVVSYVVMWTSMECSDNGMMTVDGSPATYTIMGLEEGISYMITVRASNNVGTGNGTSITARTNEAGGGLLYLMLPAFTFIVLHSPQLLMVLQTQSQRFLLQPIASLSGGKRLIVCYETE